MSLVTTERRRSYAAQRGVSQGASLTLVSMSGGYRASFECAQRAALVLGTRHLSGDTLLIPTEEMSQSLGKLEAHGFSIALVDTVTDEQGSRFVLVWRIVPRAEPVTVEMVDLNQGSLNLDDY
jgi:hypothetical protein